ncbi:MULTISPECIES: CDP-glycerol glycerophosphotransferase family protein [Bacillus]|uniref:CDP-glycerol glycerophosphotransferase family protein n=1 Tax=Bacillus TaxID=1386 RepID=UPI001965A21F|nr:MULTISPECIES: CDP-glycerol glycerophosphotransferase family protein [Bacillus]MBM7029309.1 CDP-glycerol glycerophosphotransferase family protein [Bacillus velezensis]MCX2736994.1 CDP-glycerol glycerophosphotransferase family protein [Bacillus sp. AnS8]
MGIENPVRYKLKHLNIKEETFSITISCENVTAGEEPSLQIINRKTKAELSVPLKRLAGEGGEYHAVMSTGLLSDHTDGKGCLDFYVSFINDDSDISKKRLKSSLEPIELSSYKDEAHHMFFFPYTTKKGNFSLKLLQKKFVTRIDEMDLESDGSLHLKGFAFRLNAAETLKIKEKNLILKMKKGKEEEPLILKYPLHDVPRHDLDEYVQDTTMLDTIGFDTKIDLNAVYKELNQQLIFQFHIQFIFEDAGTGEEIITNSKPLKVLKSEQVNPNQFTILKTEKGPARFHVFTKKKTKNLHLRMNDYSFSTRVEYFVKGKLKRGASFVRKRKNKLKKFIEKRIQNTYKAGFRVAGKLPVKQKFVMFESFAGKQYSCNPRAIYEYMSKEMPEYRLCWSVNPAYSQTFKDKGIPYIERFTFKWLFAMARAEYWVVNSRMPLWIPKPEHTTYVQTWHGTPLKRLAVDMDEVHMPGTNTEKYKRNFTTEASKWDYLISPNAYSTEIFARAFQFNKTMIESGYPRNDFLQTDNSPSVIKALKEKMNLPQDKKVIIYAPTWRDDQFYKKGKYKFDLDLDLHQLREAIGDRYVIILRMHYLVAENFDLGPYEGFAYDFSSYEDIRELYMVSDLLITDYSSVFFDYANLKRPMLFYVPDIETYRDKLRGFYFDFEKEAPGPLVKETGDVIKWVNETESDDYKLPDSFGPFYEKFCYLETGESSEKAVKVIFGDK